MAKEETKSESVLNSAILEYKQIMAVAAKKISESHSKEIDNLFSKMINESEVSLYKEPETVKEESQSTAATIEESTPNVDGVEAVNLKDATMKEIEEAFDAASDEDEFKVVKTDDNNGQFSLSDIEGEISEVMSEIEAADQQAQVDAVEPEDNLTKIKKIHEEMGKMIEAMDAEKSDIALKETFHSKMTEMWGEGYENKLGVVECGKMYETWKGNVSENAAAPAPAAAEAPLQEEKSSATYMPKSNVPGTFSPNTVAGGGSFPTANVPTKPIKIAEEEVVEAHGVALSNNKVAGAESQPSLENGKQYAKDKVRLALQKESVEKLQKRINTLVAENFEANKKANKATAALKEQVKLNETYKANISNYRKQLSEMALVSTNIANVNNILVSESLALSFDDKKNIINEFKTVSTVEESDKTYNKIIKEYAAEKKTIKESIEDKINSKSLGTSVSEDTKVTESTAPLNEHIEKIKRMSNYKSVR